jgi:hypothetical protein
MLSLFKLRALDILYLLEGFSIKQEISPLDSKQDQQKDNDARNVAVLITSNNLTGNDNNCFCKKYGENWVQ